MVRRLSISRAIGAGIVTALLTPMSTRSCRRLFALERESILSRRSALEVTVATDQR